MDNLEWVVEIAEAPDLDTLGGILHHRLGVYVVEGSPATERRLAERLAFEHQVRTYIARAQERGYLFACQFPGFASRWVDFVDHNKTAEAGIAKRAELRSYEVGRAHGRASPAQVESFDQPAILPASPLLAPLDPIALIERIVQDELAKRVASVPASRAEPPRLLSPTPCKTAEPAEATETRMSGALERFLEPADPKRRRKTKGRSEAASIIQFAIDFLEDPVFNSVKPSDWEQLDQALTDIPKTRIFRASKPSLSLAASNMLKNMAGPSLPALP